MSDMDNCLRDGKELTSQVPSEHQIQDEETVLVVLESITHIHYKRMIDLRCRNTY